MVQALLALLFLLTAALPSFGEGPELGLIDRCDDGVSNVVHADGDNKQSNASDEEDDCPDEPCSDCGLKCCAQTALLKHQKSEPAPETFSVRKFPKIPSDLWSQTFLEPGRRPPKPA